MAQHALSVKQATVPHTVTAVHGAFWIRSETLENGPQVRYPPNPKASATWTVAAVSRSGSGPSGTCGKQRSANDETVKLSTNHTWWLLQSHFVTFPWSTSRLQYNTSAVNCACTRFLKSYCSSPGALSSQGCNGPKERANSWLALLLRLSIWILHLAIQLKFQVLWQNFGPNYSRWRNPNFWAQSQYSTANGITVQYCAALRYYSILCCSSGIPQIQKGKRQAGHPPWQRASSFAVCWSPGGAFSGT